MFYKHIRHWQKLNTMHAADVRYHGAAYHVGEWRSGFYIRPIGGHYLFVVANVDAAFAYLTILVIALVVTLKAMALLSFAISLLR